MSKIGRKLGFILASLASSLTCLLAAYAINDQNFILFCIANLILGAGMAFTHQYRFAAAESVEKDKENYNITTHAELKNSKKLILRMPLQMLLIPYLKMQMLKLLLHFQ